MGSSTSSNLGLTIEEYKRLSPQKQRKYVKALLKGGEQNVPYLFYHMALG